MDDYGLIIIGAISLAACLYIIFVRKDHFDEYAERRQKPTCFGEYTFRYPHITAERDCERCPWVADCHKES